MTTMGDRTYRTVEHAFQAAKIALVDPVLAERFALASDTELARGDGAAQAGLVAAWRIDRCLCNYGLWPTAHDSERC